VILGSAGVANPPFRSAWDIVRRLTADIESCDDGVLAVVRSLLGHVEDGWNLIRRRDVIRSILD
jgi:hypothetical protein